MTDNPSHDLSALRDKIAGLEAVKCRMAHERVQFDARTGQPVPVGLPELGYRRIGFCSKADRARRLTCGHTMARYVLTTGVNSLAEPARTVLGAELHAVTNAIHALDHEKGDAEKRLAFIVERALLTPAPPDSADAIAFDTERMHAITAIREIEDRHGSYAERMSRLREQVLADLDALIAAGRTKPEVTRP